MGNTYILRTYGYAHIHAQTCAHTGTRTHTHTARCAHSRMMHTSVLAHVVLHIRSRGGERGGIHAQPHIAQMRSLLNSLFIPRVSTYVQYGVVLGLINVLSCRLYAHISFVNMHTRIPHRNMYTRTRARVRTHMRTRTHVRARAHTHVDI